MPDRKQLLYQQENLPIFQNRMYESERQARSCPKGDVNLVQDLDTGLIYNDAFSADQMHYDAAYQNEQGNSAFFQDHLNSVSNLIAEKIGCKDLIEVGCGKGLFLEILWSHGMEATGFDPTYEGDDERVQKEYFSHELGINGEGLILRHVLEHIVDPVDFLQDLAKANGNRGLVYIEVPCLDWIIEKNAWFDIFYEHVNYFRLNDFKKIFSSVIHADRAFGGQYLRVIADLSSINQPVYDAGEAVKFPEDFLDGMNRFSKTTAPLIVWGGASKGVIFSVLMERLGRRVDRVIDINPLKQTKFLPGTGIQVEDPANALQGMPKGSTILVMNPNYFEEIREMAGTRFNCVLV